MAETPNLALGMEENIRDVNVGTSATCDFHGLPPLMDRSPNRDIAFVDDYAPMRQPVNETR
jgi:hypothetical protein